VRFGTFRVCPISSRSTWYCASSASTACSLQTANFTSAELAWSSILAGLGKDMICSDRAPELCLELGACHGFADPGGKLGAAEGLRTASSDVFGRIYEYFLAEFSKEGAHDAGECFTPPSIVQTIVNVIEPDHGTILDPTCGSGGMVVQSSDLHNEARHILLAIILALVGVAASAIMVIGMWDAVRRLRRRRRRG
jgi:hypothetical protein